MSTNLEIEFKTLLSMSEYERLQQRFSHVKPIRQTNYYLDTADLKLRSKKLALRIRVFAHKAEMTLKVPQEVGNMEYNIDLPLPEAELLINQKSIIGCAVDLSEIISLLQQEEIPVTEIGLLGSLTTSRQEVEIPIGLAALDNNAYLGHSDYEFELEVPDAEQGREDFDNFLLKNDIEYRYARSKVVRFLDTLRHRH